MMAPSRSTEQFCASLFRTASVEWKLLAACCRWPLDAARSAVNELLIHPSNLDWELLLELGERHRVSGFLAAALREQKPLPEGVRLVLAKRAERIERENLLNVAVSLSVIRALQREGTASVILKGAPLASQVYGNIAVRHSKDVDLLVERTQLAGAERVLLENGFQRAPSLARDLTAQQARTWERYRKHHDFVHTATGCHLELHWRAFDNARLGEFAPREVEWVECSPGMLLPTIKREELFPLLCAHGAGHAWFRLKWLVDVAAMLAQGSAEEQGMLLRSARIRGLERPAEQAFLLCAGLFADARIAPPSRSTVAGRWLATVGRDALQQKIKARSPEAEFVPRRLAASRLLLRRDWRYRLEEAKVHAASPVDWKTLPLPEWLHFAYPLARVPLWFRRRLTRPRRR